MICVGGFIMYPQMLLVVVLTLIVVIYGELRLVINGTMLFYQDQSINFQIYLLHTMLGLGWTLWALFGFITVQLINAIGVFVFSIGMLLFAVIEVVLICYRNLLSTNMKKLLTITAQMPGGLIETTNDDSYSIADGVGDGLLCLLIVIEVTICVTGIWLTVGFRKYYKTKLRVFKMDKLFIEQGMGKHQTKQQG